VKGTVTIGYGTAIAFTVRFRAGDGLFEVEAGGVDPILELALLRGIGANDGA